MATPKARSAVPFLSARDLGKSKIAPFPVIGKAICCAQQSCGHAGGASFAVLHAGEGARQGHDYGGGRPEPARAHSARDVAALAGLGPRVGMAPHKRLKN